MSSRAKELLRFCKHILCFKVQFWIWSEAQGAAWGLSNGRGKFVGGYPPSMVGVKELDLPRR